MTEQTPKDVAEICRRCTAFSSSLYGRELQGHLCSDLLLNAFHQEKLESEIPYVCLQFLVVKKKTKKNRKSGSK